MFGESGRMPDAPAGERRELGSTTTSTGGREYAGDLSPRAAWDLLAGDPRAALVDCRSAAEWSFVGLADLTALGRRPARVAWQRWAETPDGPKMVPNRDFLAELGAAGVAPDAPVVFVCRSGVRSRSAAIAASAAGWNRAYNLAGGFEGGHDSERHRGRTDGWKAAGLPWTQE